MYIRQLLTTIFLVTALSLSACGGGSAGNANDPGTTPTNPGGDTGGDDTGGNDTGGDDTGGDDTGGDDTGGDDTGGDDTGGDDTGGDDTGGDDTGGDDTGGDDTGGDDTGGDDTGGDDTVEPESITVQAEDFTDAFDTTDGNTGEAFREGNVDIEIATDVSGEFNVGWTATGEWLEYTITLQGGLYRLSYRVASNVSGGSFTVNLDGVEVIGTQSIGPTGGWQSWMTMTSSTVDLPAGEHTVRINIQGGEFNLNWIRFDTSDGNDPDEGDDGSDIDMTEPVWSDEFSTINTANWTFETGGGGWGNNEFQYYTNGDNASIAYDEDIDSDVLVIEARQENPVGYTCSYTPAGGAGSCAYTSTRLISSGKQEFMYGRMEARIKLPQTQGIWPAFWMLGNNIFTGTPWPTSGEIDIMEHVGFEPQLTHGALHGPGYSGNTPFAGTHNLQEQVDADYHVYAIEWDADSISWFVDDVNFFNVNKAQVEQYGTWVFDHPFFFLFNIAVGGNWPGSPNETSTFPQRMYIDYVRVYQ